jgi:hypothetical protein
MLITKIFIENIRGFENVELDVQLRPNCANILVAPNGFGKSSISTAFSCAQGSKLNVKETEKYNNQESAPSKLRIKVDDEYLDATEYRNDISKRYDIHVIRSDIEPKAKLPKINGFTIAKPYMEIPDVDLGPVSKNEILKYDLKHFKLEIGVNSKIVPNLVVTCNNNLLKSCLFNKFGEFGKLNGERCLALLNEIIEHAKIAKGTRIVINKDIEALFRVRVDKMEFLKTILDILSSFQPSRTWLERLLLIYQLSSLYAHDRGNLKKWLQFAVYTLRVQVMRDFIGDINAAWVGATIREIRGRLVIKFPDARALSNGQRDLLYFGSSLLRTREITSNKPAILCIDEIFDYLDDANILVAQYFLSRIIDYYRDGGREIYILIFTHLNPLYFKGYALKRQNTIYLGTSSQKVTDTMRKVISERDDPTWASEISRHFLHYNPAECDISEVFNGTFGLPKRYGKSHAFYEFLKGEWDKCAAGTGSYDPFAVCAHLRIQIERCAYERIDAEADRDTFISSTNGTANKLIFAESVGVVIPESCFLLGVIYNDALHRKGGLDKSSTIALKLRNLALQSMMKKAINW